MGQEGRMETGKQDTVAPKGRMMPNWTGVMMAMVVRRGVYDRADRTYCWVGCENRRREKSVMTFWFLTRANKWMELPFT